MRDLLQLEQALQKAVFEQRYDAAQALLLRYADALAATYSRLSGPELSETLIRASGLIERCRVSALCARAQLELSWAVRHPPSPGYDRQQPTAPRLTLHA